MSTTRQHGLSLIELLVFIVVVGIAVTGVLQVYSSTSRTSADPMVRKQAMAVAESLLEEVLSKPYTYCDPDDAQADTATGAFIGPTGCATTIEALGPETAQGEDRYLNTTPFDNVNDYNNFNMSANPGPGIIGLDGVAVPGLIMYSALIQVRDAGAFNGIPAGETLLVTVTVTGPGNHSITLSGYRTRYAPTL